MKKTSVNYRMVLTLISFLFYSSAPFPNLENIFMHMFVFRPSQSSSLMITSQTTCMVRRWGRYSYNTHGTILKPSSRGRRMDGQSSTGTSLKLQGPSTSLKLNIRLSLQQFSRWDSSIYLPSMMLISKGYRCCMWNLVMVQLCNGVASYMPIWCNRVLKLYDVLLWCIPVMKS